MDRSELDLLVASRLELRGEEIWLRREQRPVSSWLNPKGYRWLSIPLDARGNGKRLLYARTKLRLLNGYWPVEVDHVDRDPSNDLASNLRDVTRCTNMQNVSAPQRDLPRGVYKTVRGAGYQAAIRRDRVYHNLGYFKTPEDALSAINAFKASRGELP